MARESALTQILTEGYAKIFYQNWPMWVGGILIGLLSILTFVWSRPWGVAGGIKNWGDWIFYITGLYQQAPKSALLSSSSVLTLGLLWGAFASSLMAKQFALRSAPGLELIKGMFGGIFMGIGSSMAGGCNVGGFYSASAALSLSGLAMMAGLIIGAFGGLKYLYWELEHIPSGGTRPVKKKQGIKLKDKEPWIGILTYSGAVFCAWLYSLQGLTITGGLLLCGLGFGTIIQRSRLCFARCFREPFMSGDGTVSRAVAISIIISVLGSAALKWNGIRGELIYVPQAFWAGGLLGGIIFGFGMIIAGGCGSGSVWRAGEGQTKLIIAVVFFALSMSLFEKFTALHPAFAKFLGTRVFLPHYLGYGASVLLIILVMLGFYLITTWNERTEKFVIEL